MKKLKSGEEAPPDSFALSVKSKAVLQDYSNADSAAQGFRQNRKSENIVMLTGWKEECKALAVRRFAL